MKKLLATMLCVVMIASMAITANAQAIRLPDGGQIANTGCSQAYGYTDGGTSGRAYMNCTIEITSASTGKVVGWTTSNVTMGSSLYMSVIAWQDVNQNNRLAKNELRAPSSTGTSYSLAVYGGSATAKGTAGHQYSSAAYGDWICGTATN